MHSDETSHWKLAYAGVDHANVCLAFLRMAPAPPRVGLVRIASIFSEYDRNACFTEGSKYGLVELPKVRATSGLADVCKMLHVGRAIKRMPNGSPPKYLPTGWNSGQTADIS